MISHITKKICILSICAITGLAPVNVFANNQANCVVTVKKASPAAGGRVYEFQTITPADTSQDSRAHCTRYSLALNKLIFMKDIALFCAGTNPGQSCDVPITLNLSKGGQIGTKVEPVKIRNPMQLEPTTSAGDVNAQQLE